MEIRTSEHIRNVSQRLLNQSDNLYHTKKWVAVDDELDFLEKTLYVLEYENVFDVMDGIKRRIEELKKN